MNTDEQMHERRGERGGDNTTTSELEHTTGLSFTQLSAKIVEQPPAKKQKCSEPLETCANCAEIIIGNESQPLVREWVGPTTTDAGVLSQL